MSISKTWWIWLSMYKTMGVAVLGSYDLTGHMSNNTFFSASNKVTWIAITHVTFWAKPAAKQVHIVPLLLTQIFFLPKASRGDTMREMIFSLCAVVQTSAVRSPSLPRFFNRRQITLEYWRQLRAKDLHARFWAVVCRVKVEDSKNESIGGIFMSRNLHFQLP